MPDEGLGVLVLIRMVEKSTPEFFSPDRVIHISRAPGRIEILGGLGRGERDLTLQLATSEAAGVAVQRRSDEFMRVFSPCNDGSRTDRLSVRLQDLGLPGEPISYQEARAFLCADPKDAWIAHLFGAVLVLAREHGHTIAGGFDMMLSSDIPEGRGAGSSAAIEVASLSAISRAFGLGLDDDELVAIARTVERHILRLDVGGAAQRTAVRAKSGAVLALRGEHAQVESSIAVPTGLEFVGLELGTACAIAQVDVAVAKAESERAERFAALLQQPLTDASRWQMGELMFTSHAARGITGDRRLGEFVIRVAQQRRAAGAALWGAVMAGRGTVVVLGDQTKAWHESLRLKKALREETGHSAHVFRYSSPGAAAFGALELSPVGG
jgi:galactokinase